MELKDIVKHLNVHIDMRMKEFDRIAKESKRLRQEAEKKEEHLVIIFNSLKDVHPMIYAQYPERKEFFDALVQIAKDNNE